jgi:7-carboxy-7-deazaguanine synthase
VLSQDKNTLPIVERFYSVQGEGYYSGTAAFFIRTAGCDVGCVWCDVKESWELEGHPILEINKLVEEVQLSNTSLVVITGGEPAMHDLSLLTSKLKEIGKVVAIETSGTNDLIGKFNWVTFSPKKFKAPVESIFNVANELKIIVFNKHDLKWANELALKVNDNCLLFLQPEWDKREEMMPLITEFVKENIQWKISLQTHKYLNIR